MPRASSAERFWTKVDVRGPDECWLWTAYRSLHGYGRLGDEFAHRVSWKLANGRDPGRGVVRHTCDNPPCVNPHHLRLGTQADNLADMHAKGRASGGSSPGEHNPMAKLTELEVRAIRGETDTTGRELAARYGVSKQLISAVRNNKAWRHVT